MTHKEYTYQNYIFIINCLDDKTQLEIKIISNKYTYIKQMYTFELINNIDKFLLLVDNVFKQKEEHYIKILELNNNIFIKIANNTTSEFILLNKVKLN